MKILVGARHGEAAAIPGDGASGHAAGPAPDPGAPDLSRLTDAVALARRGRPEGMQQLLRSFLDTFRAVVTENAANAIDPASLVRLQELAAQARAGQIPPGDPQLARLAAAARRHGKAVAAVYGFFLRFAPYAMFSELRGAGLSAFQPLVGPVLVVVGDAVRDVLSRHAEFTVDPYGAEMVKTMTSSHNGPDGGPGLGTFVLSTDDDALYEPDKRLLTEVVRREDVRHLREPVARECRARVARAVREARSRGERQLDVVRCVARFVPVTLGRIYLGVPLAEHVQRFDLTDDMLRWYGEPLRGGPAGDEKLDGTGLARADGTIADEATMYEWIKSAFECFFNNVQKDPDVQRAGLRSCRLLLCSLLREVEREKARLKQGLAVAPLGREPRDGQVRDTMLSRLVRLQLEGRVPAGQITDLRIAENVMGTMVGAVAGQEEATCRVVDALLKLKEGAYRPSRSRRARASFDDARELALTVLDPGSGGRARFSARRRLFHYFRECLRMEPQGEVLLRQCVADGARLLARPCRPRDAALAAFAGNRPLRAGDLVFAAHGSAMKDVRAADEFRLRRHPDDATYLFYGYGRHKCLGQHVSPLVIVETMIALLALEDLQRAGPFLLDDKNLYARSLSVTFSDRGSTLRHYPE